jgi:predicted DNA-binding transcriptional regulator AlpA
MSSNLEMQTKAIVTVSEMARMMGLSRARLYQLQRSGSLPSPLYHIATRRPVYVEEQQRICLEVRRRNCGIDGRPILFYAHRLPAPAKVRPIKVAPNKNRDITGLMEGLNSLGLTTATASQIEEITKELFPSGTCGIIQSEVLRAVFLHLKRKNSGDNVGR